MPHSKVIIGRLVDECVAGRAHFQIWWVLGNRALPKFLGTMNDMSHVDFFHAANSGHFILYLLSLGKIFDRDTRVAGIAELRRALRAEGNSARANLIARELKPFEPQIRRVMRIRNRLIAHNEHAVSPEQLFLQNGVTPNELGQLIDNLGRIINDAARETGLPQRVFDSKRYESATLSMLESLRHGVRSMRA